MQLTEALPPKPPREDVERRSLMRMLKRLAVAGGSLLALVLAGGAHFKF